MELDTELECQERAREAEILFLRQQNELEVTRAKQLGAIEVGRAVGGGRLLTDSVLAVCVCGGGGPSGLAVRTSVLGH